jgi:hypothetical protein
MRRILSITSMLCLGLGLAACSDSADKSQPGASDDSARGPAWSLTLKSACAGAETDQCVAKYGFSVTADGKYQVGPGPQNQFRKGSLSESEMSELNSKLQAALAGAALDAGREESHETGVQNEDEDSLVYVQKDSNSILARSSGEDFFFRTAKLEDAQALHKAIRDLAKTYYLLPFGNECGDQADALEALYVGVQGCQSDADCVYVDAYQAYSVIPPNSDQWIFVDDCRAAKPMTVANKSSIQGGAEKLQAAYDLAAQSCGEQFFRADCSCQYGQAVNAPACVQNRCQARF